MSFTPSPGNSALIPSAAQLLAKLTGAATLAAGALLYGAGTATLSTLTVGTANTVLTSSGTAPQWSTSIAPTGTVASKQASAAGIGLDPNAATGDFTAWMSPQNLTATRRYSFPDATLYMSGSAAALTANRLPSATGVYGVLQDSKVADGITAGKVLTLVAANTYTLTVPETMTVAGRNVANTFTDAQQISVSGSTTGLVLTYNSTTPSPLLTGGLQLVGADSGNPFIEIDIFGVGNGGFLVRQAGGTSAVKTASANNQILLQFQARGYDGAAYAVNEAAGIRIQTAEAVTSTNQGGALALFATRIGSTSLDQIGYLYSQSGGIYTWMIGNTSNPCGFYKDTSNRLGIFTGSVSSTRVLIDTSGNIGIGVTPTAGAGLLQLPSGTTIANGILLGDVGVNRNAANALTINATAGLTLTGNLTIASGMDLKIGSTYAAGAPTVTGYLTIKDATGTTYKVAVGT